MSGEAFLPDLSMQRDAVISTLGLPVPWKFGKNFYGVLKTNRKPLSSQA